jgi:ceroid-lipofuscinosis MFS transporter 7
MMQKFLIALALVGLVDAISYMVVAPSLVFYVLKYGGTKEQYGIILSAFSFASFLANPFLGAWSDTVGFRISYFTSLSLSALGGVIYLLASLATTHVAVAMMLCGRLLGGVGAASASLGFAYMAKVVPHDQQTKTSSFLSMVRLLGMASGPGVNVFLTKIDMAFLGLTLDPLNSVGLVLVVSNLIALSAIYFFLAEPTEDINRASSHDLKSESSMGSTGWWSVVRTFARPEIFVPILSIFTLNANFQL